MILLSFLLWRAVLVHELDLGHFLEFKLGCVFDDLLKFILEIVLDFVLLRLYVSPNLVDLFLNVLFVVGKVVLVEEVAHVALLVKVFESRRSRWLHQ